jgi:hypothetical protein
MKRLTFLTVIVAAATAQTIFAASDWRSGIAWTEPPIVTPGEKPSDPPSDAIILFNGKDLSAWEQEKWTVNDDGSMTCKPGSGSLVTKQKFGSVQLHIEFATPEKVNGNGQGRGNSGVFLMNHYEVQVLDSYENQTYFDGQCSSIYKQRAPLVNVCKKPGEWQTYDIIFTRPVLKIEDNKVVEVIRPAFITVFQNGVLTVWNHAIEGDTFYHIPPAYQVHGDKESISLQDHGNLTKFRNIWVREIPDTNEKPPRTREPYYNDAPH